MYTAGAAGETFLRSFWTTPLWGTRDQSYMKKSYRPCCLISHQTVYFVSRMSSSEVRTTSKRQSTHFTDGCGKRQNICNYILFLPPPPPHSFFYTYDIVNRPPSPTHTHTPFWQQSTCSSSTIASTCCRMYFSFS